MRIIFIGTPQIAVPSLEILIESEEVIAVITQPDKASGRGKNIVFSPVKQTALDKGITVLQPESVKDEEFLDEIEKLNPELIVVVAYSQKIPQRMLEMAKYGCINVHPSLLPKYRGATPIMGPILNGDEVTGVTIMKMAEGLDCGDILLQEEMPIERKETVASLEEKAAAKGASMLLKVIDGFKNGTILAIPQDESKHSYVRQITKEEGRIDFGKSAAYIERLIRACTPWPSAFTTLDGKTFKIWDAEVIDVKEHTPEAGKECPNKAICHGEDGKKLMDVPPGTVTFVGKKTLIVKCQEGCLDIKEVQIEGKKRMTIEEFLRGRKIEQGYCLGK